MTTSSRKSYNNNAKYYDDMEYVEKYNLDPSVAYTPKINEAIAGAIRKENEAWYLKQGDKPEVAKMKAQNKYNEAMRDMK